MGTETVSFTFMNPDGSFGETYSHERVIPQKQPKLKSGRLSMGALRAAAYKHSAEYRQRRDRDVGIMMTRKELAINSRAYVENLKRKVMA